MSFDGQFITDHAKRSSNSESKQPIDRTRSISADSSEDDNNNNNNSVPVAYTGMLY